MQQALEEILRACPAPPYPTACRIAGAPSGSALRLSCRPQLKAASLLATTCCPSCAVTSLPFCWAGVQGLQPPRWPDAQAGQALDAWR
jgi:hypothetical protein